MIKWLENIIRKRNTKKFIKSFIENSANSVVLKQWEHNSWGDAIYTRGCGFYGHLSGIRQHGGICFCCDLHNRDVIVIKSPDLTRSEGKPFQIGLFANVEVQSDPRDMFFAKFVHLGFAYDYSMETIIRLAKERIKEL